MEYKIEITKRAEWDLDQYLMVFRIDEDEKTVYILRFFYGAQYYEKLL